MAQDWLELTKLTGEAPFIVERVRLADKQIRIEGEFDLPPLARLSTEDQVFVMAFVRSDGSIKELERIFGISYPTVKNRLARIASQFEFAHNGPSSIEKESPVGAVNAGSKNQSGNVASVTNETIELLRQGGITAAEAIERLSK